MQFRPLRLKSAGFTLVEVMTGIIVFSIGMIAIFLLVDSGIWSARLSRDEVIAANLMREQIELLKNTRDSNWLMLRRWDKIWLEDTVTGYNWKTLSNTSNQITPGYYTIENNYTSSDISGNEFQYPLNDQHLINKAIPVRMRYIGATTDSPESLVKNAFASTPNNTRLCIDIQERYTYTCTGNSPTPFAGFTKIEPLMVAWEEIPNAMIVTAYIGTLNKWTRLYEVRTLLTHWK